MEVMYGVGGTSPSKVEEAFITADITCNETSNCNKKGSVVSPESDVTVCEV